MAQIDLDDELRLVGNHKAKNSQPAVFGQRLEAEYPDKQSVPSEKKVEFFK